MIAHVYIGVTKVGFEPDLSFESNKQKGANSSIAATAYGRSV